jgi:uncharacterized protein YdeI (YjbR/CyaY-like superfamily)
MNIGETLYLAEREQWRAWLAKHHSAKKEIWLVYFRKSSGKPRISYNDAVEEALCYGWIDSTAKGIDEEKFAQRFSPRQPGSQLSEMNKERIRRLIKKRKMTAIGLKAVSKTFDWSKDKNDRFIVAPDILKSLKTDRQAWKHFQELPEWYKRVRIGYIEGRRRQGKGVFKKSLAYFMKMTAKNKKFGFLRQ